MQVAETDNKHQKFNLSEIETISSRNKATSKFGFRFENQTTPKDQNLSSMSNYSDNYKLWNANFGSRQSVAEADLNDWRYEEQQTSPNRMTSFPFPDSQPNSAMQPRHMSFSRSNTQIRRDSSQDDEFTVRPSYTTIFAVWISSILDDVIGFACDKPHLSAASGMLLMLSASPFLAMLAGTVCCALMAVLFLTCTEGALIAVFMFMFACFVISTAIVSLMTLMTIYVIHATVMGIYNQIVAARDCVTGTVKRYYSLMIMLKKRDQMAAAAERKSSKETSPK